MSPDPAIPPAQRARPWQRHRPRPLRQTMLSALDLYLEGSFFNNHIAQQRSQNKPRNVMALYRTLSAETPYPLDDLVPAGHDLDWLLSGQAWRGGGRR